MTTVGAGSLFVRGRFLVGHASRQDGGPVFVTAGGRRLEVRVLEPASAASVGADIVMLHEGLGSVALWKGFPDRVAAATGRRVWVYSRAGYGKSAPAATPRPVTFMHDEALVVLPELLAALGIEAPILLGHSDGSSIALIHAGAGHRVRGVIAMAPHVVVEEVTLTSIEAARTAFAEGRLRSALAGYHDDVDGAFAGWSTVWLRPGFRDWTIEDYLPSINAPCLVIQGEQDQYGTLSQVMRITEAVAEARSLLLPDCAHAPHVDQPETTLAAITEFVSAVE